MLEMNSLTLAHMQKSRKNLERWMLSSGGGGRAEVGRRGGEEWATVSDGPAAQQSRGRRARRATATATAEGAGRSGGTNTRRWLRVCLSDELTLPSLSLSLSRRRRRCPRGMEDTGRQQPSTPMLPQEAAGQRKAGEGEKQGGDKGTRTLRAARWGSWGGPSQRRSGGARRPQAPPARRRTAAGTATSPPPLQQEASK